MMDLVGIHFKMHMAYIVFVNSIAMAYIVFVNSIAMAYIVFVNSIAMAYIPVTIDLIPTMVYTLLKHT